MNDPELRFQAGCVLDKHWGEFWFVEDARGKGPNPDEDTSSCVLWPEDRRPWTTRFQGVAEWAAEKLNEAEERWRAEGGSLSGDEVAWQIRDLMRIRDQPTPREVARAAASKGAEPTEEGGLL